MFALTLRPKSGGRTEHPNNGSNGSSIRRKVWMVPMVGLVLGVLYVWQWAFTLRGFFASWLIGSGVAALMLVLPLNRLRFPVLVGVMAVMGGAAGLVWFFAVEHHGNPGIPVVIGACYAAAIAFFELPRQPRL